MYTDLMDLGDVKELLWILLGEILEWSSRHPQWFLEIYPSIQERMLCIWSTNLIHKFFHIKAQFNIFPGVQVALNV